VANALFTAYDAYDPAHRGGLPLIPGVSPVRQMAFILQHPVRYAWIVAASLGQRAGFLLRSFVGILGQGEAALFPGHVPLYALVLGALAVVDERPRASLSWRDRVLAASVVLASLVLFCTLQYLQWAPVGQARVDGLHGRYLIPLGPLAFALLQNARVTAPPAILRGAATAAVAASVAAAVATLLLHYR